MSATLVSSNTTIKVNAAVSANNSSTSGTIYTAPANGYAIVNILNSNAANTVSIGGQLVISAVLINPSNIFYVGPSQAITYAAGAINQIRISGVEFVNTP